MTAEPFHLNLSGVIQKELDLIAERRDAQRCDSPPDNGQSTKGADVHDLTGLALSGGGIRAASLSLGLVQAFDALGFMRVFDYLSTVSGGGYLGGYLSSSVAVRDEPNTRLNGARLYPELQEIKVVKAGVSAGQPDRVRRFIFGGKYLHKPWQLGNKYLIGLFFNSFAILSGVAFLCCFTAFFIRFLDFDAVRDFAEIFGLNYDTNMAFLPFIVCLAAWLAAWFGSYWLRQAEAPGRFAQALLYFTAGFFLVGCVLILVNGQTTLNYVAQAIFNTSAIDHDGTVKSLLLTIIAAGLIPFLNPRSLAQRGLHPKGLLDRFLFRFSCTCLLVGIPLVGVGYFGSQNISRTAGSPENKFSAGDIYDWGAFCELLAPSAKDVQQSLESTPTYPEQADILQTLHDVEKLLETREKAWELKRDMDKAWPLIGAKAFEWWREQRNLDRLQVAVCDRVNNFILPSPAIVDALAKDQHAKDKGTEEHGLLLAINEYMQSPPTGHGINEYKRDGESVRPPVCSLTAVEKLITSNAKRPELGVPESRFNAALEGIRQAETYPFHIDDDEWRAFNQNLLVSARPDCFKNLDDVHRAVVTGPDQITRLKWLGFLAVTFLVGLSIDLNATSLHRFYRNRLSFAYLNRHKGKAEDIKLSQLDTTKSGGPYHLINASLNRFDSRFGHLLEEFEKERLDGEPDRRSTRNFLFSRLVCGSEVTGFVSTEHFEKMTLPRPRRILRGKSQPPITLADAVAISGAAIDPLQFDFAPLAWMMTALNLRLGQWLPNPAVQDENRIKPHSAHLWTMLKDIPREVDRRELCFVSDGGFNENLGVIALLKRRCKLIVALDAGCDPREAFSDLAKVIRMARVGEGISICALPTGDESHPKSSELDVSQVRRIAEGISVEHFVVGLIQYPSVDDKPPEEGLLVYVKPSFTGDEGADLFAYRAADGQFPHDTTADQLFDEARVEAYRRLGYHIGKRVFDRLFSGAVDGANVDHMALRAAATHDAGHEAVSASQGLEKIADAVRSLNGQVVPGAGIRAVQSLASMAGHLVDKDGHFADDHDAVEEFGKLSDHASALSKELEGLHSTNEQSQVAESLKRLAEVWQLVATRLAEATATAGIPETGLKNSTKDGGKVRA